MILFLFLALSLPGTPGTDVEMNYVARVGNEYLVKAEVECDRVAAEHQARIQSTSVAAVCMESAQRKIDRFLHEQVVDRAIRHFNLRVEAGEPPLTAEEKEQFRKQGIALQRMFEKIAAYKDGTIDRESLEEEVLAEGSVSSAELRTYVDLTPTAEAARASAANLGPEAFLESGRRNWRLQQRSKAVEEVVTAMPEIDEADDVVNLFVDLFDIEVIEPYEINYLGGMIREGWEK